MFESLHRFYRKLRYGEPIIVVSGLPRSGTSMAMKMLDAAGFPLVVDGVRTADEDNPKGYFELEKVKDLDKTDDKSWLRGARGRCVKIISFWLKDLSATHNYRVIFMHRNIHEVLASQTKMLDRRGEQNDNEDERMLELYKNHIRKVKYLIDHCHHIEAIGVDYKGVLENPLEQARRINRFLGGHLVEEKMVSVVDENLYRSRVS